MQTTASRLKEVMDAKKLKQVDVLRLAEPYCSKYMVKLNKSDLSQFVNGKVIPGQFKLKILALSLGVNEAWLMGYDNVPMESASPELSAPAIPLFDPEPLIAARNSHGFEPEEVAALSGVDYNTYISIEQGFTVPDIYQLQAIAHVLYTSPNVLLKYYGNLDFLEKVDYTPTPDDLALFELFMKLPFEDRRDLVSYITSQLKSKGLLV